MFSTLTISAGIAVANDADLVQVVAEVDGSGQVVPVLFKSAEKAQTYANWANAGGSGFSLINNPG